MVYDIYRSVGRAPCVVSDPRAPPPTDRLRFDRPDDKSCRRSSSSSSSSCVGKRARSVRPPAVDWLTERASSGDVTPNRRRSPLGRGPTCVFVLLRPVSFFSFSPSACCVRLQCDPASAGGLVRSQGLPAGPGAAAAAAAGLRPLSRCNGILFTYREMGNFFSISTWKTQCKLHATEGI